MFSKLLQPKSLKVWIAAAVLSLGVASGASARDFCNLWIGNSLMMGYWTCTEAWAFVGDVMITPNADALGMSAHCTGITRGATDIPAHWNADVAAGSGTGTAIGELNAPAGYNRPSAEVAWIQANVSNYDYIALQGYQWSAAKAASEYDYCSRYYDLALTKGTKPIIFACWQGPQDADAAIAIYDSLFRKYRSQGAIYAPVIQAHRLIWNDSRWGSETEMTQFLYDNDAYHHINKRGAWLMDCVFYEVFTGQSAVGITRDDIRPNCMAAADVLDQMSDADILYLEEKAHQAVVEYYGGGTVPYLGYDPATVIKQKTTDAQRNVKQPFRYFDLRGNVLPQHALSSRSSSVIIAVTGHGNRKNVAEAYLHKTSRFR